MVNQGLWSKVCSYQCLRSAWNKVRENAGGPGIDGITLEQFEQNLEENLTLLQCQLEKKEYVPLPILRIYIDRGNSTKRPIGIPAVRDRIVQQSLLSVLSPIFEKEFLDCSFAYRPGRSALDAVSHVEALVKNGHRWVLDGDIESFFDSIDHELLFQFVEEKLTDSKIVKLLHEFLRANIFENMSLREEYLGIAQGSVISPLLANVYLHRFDQALVAKGYHLIRYADDFVVLEDSQERVGKALGDAADVLKKLKLNLNESKTRLIHAKEGFVFLGYYIDDKGKGPSRKAIDVISGRLREMSEADQRGNMNAKVENLKQSIRGWNNYFHSCRGIEPEAPLILIALMEMSLELGDVENANRLFDKRSAFTLRNPEIHCRLGHLAQTLGMRGEALAEFSQALFLNPEHLQAKEALKQIELVDEDVYASIERLRKLIHFCPDLPQPYRDLASCYAEIGEYGLAKESHQKALQMESEVSEEKPLLEVLPSFAPKPATLAFTEEDISLFLSLFRGKEGFFAQQWVDDRGRKGFYPVAHSLNSEDIKNHLSGKETLGLYLMTEEDRVHLSVIDIDISQKALLEYAKDKERLAELHNLAHKEAVKIASICDDLGIPVVIEDSGYKGRHLWFFFAQPISAKLARRFLKFISDRAGTSAGGIHREIFPTSDKSKGYGPLIKLPLGIHKRTNRRCLFLDREGNPIPDQINALRQLRPITQKEIEDILLTYSAKPKVAKIEQESPLVNRLLSGCKVINYLVNKAKETHYLDNSERVTLLYTIGHLGEEGKAFIHKVMSYCINYDYEITEKHIRKIKPYPISCAKIREKHETIALELGCDCTFKLPPKGYPSPILHAFSQPKDWMPGGSISEESITRTEDKVTSEGINAKLKRYIELKKQLRGIEKSLNRTEEEMSSYLNQLGTDSIQTEYGLLVRRKSGDGFDWVIKL